MHGTNHFARHPYAFMKKRTQLTLALLACALIGISFALAANFGYKLSRFESIDRRDDLTRLIVVLQPTKGSETVGTVSFLQLREDRILITGEIGGLAPEQTYSIYIHEYGDMRSTDGMATGEHYSPEAPTHRQAAHHPRSVGYLGTLTPNVDGIAILRTEVSHLTLNGQINPIIGRSLVVQTRIGEDSQRLAQGIIGVMNPQFSP